MSASARLVFNPAAPAGGIHLANFARYVILAQQELARAYAVAVQVTASGTTPANLETGTEFAAGTGQGAALQAAMVSCNSAMATMQTAIGTTLAQLDQG